MSPDDAVARPGMDMEISTRMLFLSKLLPIFVYPLGFAILLVALSLLLSFTRFRRTARLGLVAAMSVLWIASMPAFANWFYAGLEARHPPVPIDTLSMVDVAIVLGGAVGQPLPPRTAPDVGEPADRILHAARLFHAGKTGQILVTGGNIPWQAAVAPEAELIAELLVELGVPRAAIVVETQSRNTYENAVYCTEIIKDRDWRSVILVTSGAHMPRALAVFSKAGIEAIPASTDIRVRFPLYESLLDFLPDAEALKRTSDAIREWIGIVVYRLRGWA